MEKKISNTLKHIAQSGVSCKEAGKELKGASEN